MFKPSKASAALSRLQRQSAITALTSIVMLGAASLALASTLGTTDSAGFSPGKFVTSSLLVFAIALVLFARSLPDHLPHERIGPANLVTLFRLGLTSLLAGLVGVPDATLAWVALSLATPALLLDGIDGWLARRGGWTSAFGARFDMETDAFLIALLSILVWQFDKAGVWILLAGGLRYLFVAAAYALPWMNRELPTSLRRKTVCVVQVVSLLLALVPLLEAPASNAIALTGLTALLISFTLDTLWLFRGRLQHAA